MGKISATEASPAVAWGWGKGGGARRHALDAAVPWYQILVSCSDWSNVFMLTDSRGCWQYRVLSMSRLYHYAPTKSVIKPPNQFIYAKNACCVQLRLVLREGVNHNCTEILRDLLWNLFGCSSPVAGRAFSSATSLFLFAEAGVTLAVYFFSAHIALHCPHDLNSWNRLVLLQLAVKVK